MPSATAGFGQKSPTLALGDLDHLAGGQQQRRSRHQARPTRHEEPGWFVRSGRVRGLRGCSSVQISPRSGGGRCSRGSLVSMSELEVDELGDPSGRARHFPIHSAKPIAIAGAGTVENAESWRASRGRRNWTAIVRTITTATRGLARSLGQPDRLGKDVDGGVDPTAGHRAGEEPPNRHRRNGR